MKPFCHPWELIDAAEDARKRGDVALATELIKMTEDLKQRNRYAKAVAPLAGPTNKPLTIGMKYRYE
jgi:hypothetical protein